jgi:hypothetical protein
MQPAPRGKPPQISPIFTSEKVTPTVSREKDGKSGLLYAHMALRVARGRLWLDWDDLGDNI